MKRMIPWLIIVSSLVGAAGYFFLASLATANLLANPVLVVTGVLNILGGVYMAIETGRGNLRFDGHMLAVVGDCLVMGVFAWAFASYDLMQRPARGR